jgi:AIPR protein
MDESVLQRAVEEAARLEMSNIQIVNSGQTSNTLFEAFQQDPERCRNVLVLVRVYETKRREISAKIAESTNSQTPIRSRDLRSNEEVQKKIEESFKNLGYYYERKSNQYREQPRHLRIDALFAGQAYLVYQLHLREVAGKDRGKIFGELYDEIFNDDITAPLLLAPLQVFQPIEEMKRNLERAVRRGQTYDPAMLFLVDGAYHLLFAIAMLSTLRNIDHWQAEKAVAQLEDATRVVQAAVRREASDPAFANKRFLKSTRARRYIEEAARELVTPRETA